MSIVNSALIHPHLPLVATAGVERNVFLHSPTSSTPYTQDLEIIPCHVRRWTDSTAEDEYEIMQWISSSSRSAAEDAEELKTLSFFDQ